MLSPNRKVNQQPKKNNHKAKKSGSEDCIYSNQTNYSIQKYSSKQERPLAKARSETSYSDVKSDKFELYEASPASLRRVRVRNKENAADIKDVHHFFNLVYISSLVSSKPAGKQFIIKSNPQLSSTDSKDEYLYVSIHSAHEQEDEPEEIVITDLSRMEQIHTFNKQPSNKDSSDLVIYEEELLSRPSSLPIHPDQSHQHRSFTVSTGHSVSMKDDSRLRSLIAILSTGMATTTHMTYKSEYGVEDMIKPNPKDNDSSTFPQENGVKGHQLLDSESEKLYGVTKDEEEKRVYEEILQRVAVAKARVLKQQQKLQYCAISEEDFTRAQQQASLSDEQGGISSFSDKEADSNPQLQKLQYCAISEEDFTRARQQASLYSSQLDEHGGISSFSDEEADSNPQVTTPVENLENIAPLNGEMVGGHVLKPLEQPYDKENELPSGIVEACKKGESLEKCLELWRQVKSEERIIKEKDVRLQELEVRKREQNIQEKQMSNELPSWISEAVSKGGCLKDLLELWREKEKEERQERIQQREEERRIKEYDVRLQELEVRKRELDMRKKEMSKD